MSTEQTQPTTVQQVTSAISNAASVVTDEAAALFGSAKDAVAGTAETTKSNDETTSTPLSIAEAAPVRFDALVLESSRY